MMQRADMFRHLSWFIPLIVVGGCTWLNPYERQSWVEEEAKYGPSYPTRKAELEKLANTSLSPQEQEETAADLTRKLTQEKNPLMRTEITRTLGSFDNAPAMEGLTIAVRDPDRHVRLAACNALAKQSDEEAAALLSATIGRDSDDDVRLAAVRGLAGKDHPRAYIGLGLALDDSDPAMKLRAVRSLRTLSDEDYGDKVNDWREFARRSSGNDVILAEQPDGGLQR